MNPLINLVQVLILGVVVGGVYALMASGLTLIFGVMRIVNIAHAAFMLVAAYLSVILFNNLQLDPVLSVGITAPVLFLLGLGIYRLLLQRWASSHHFTLMTLLVTFSLALILEGILATIFTGAPRGTRPDYAMQALLLGPFFIPRAQAYAGAASGVMLVLLFLFLEKSRLGRAIRATMQNRRAAQIVGVDVNQVSAFSFGLGLAMAGAGGSLMSFLFSIVPGLHWRFITIILSIVVLGGMGSLGGAVVGALVLAVVASFVANYVSVNLATTVFYLALFVMLLVKPEGLFGEKGEL